MNFDACDPDPAIHDEMFPPDGTPRAHRRALHDALKRLPDNDMRTSRT